MPCGARGDLDHIEAQLYRMGTAHISNLRQQIYRQKHPMQDELHRVFFVGRAALPTPTRLDNCTAKSEVPAQNNRRHCEAAGRGNPYPLRCEASPVPGGDGKRTDCQKVNCPKGKRGHPGVRAYALAMTAVDGSRCFCREIAVVASGRRGQCHTPYGVITDLALVRRSYGRSGRTGRR